ncbi:hypothetical protein [Salidesulfovibrio onnuriiensis]|uniref:hypothetical protein n=1 Tax=Salidesulfovibrio onnuriiensis TaxID=2583823 RepID=UPI0011CC9A5A|nr:hypothetical protein [Salidesulfovibrio onnuriiensis]
MPHLHHWRVLYAEPQKPFLAARVCTSFPSAVDNPCPRITSQIPHGDVQEGDTIISKSGTSYHLGEPLPSDDDCEFARGLLLQRCGKNAEAEGRILSVYQLEEACKLITEILTGEEPSEN